MGRRWRSATGSPIIGCRILWQRPWIHLNETVALEENAFELHTMLNIESTKWVPDKVQNNEQS